MDKLNPSDWAVIITTLGVIVSIIAAVSALLSKTREGAAADTELKSDVKHIKLMVESTAHNVEQLAKQTDKLDSRLIRAEESCKSAHKRIDGLFINPPS